jgi:hypothetical protein
MHLLLENTSDEDCGECYVDLAFLLLSVHRGKVCSWPSLTHPLQESSICAVLNAFSTPDALYSGLLLNTLFFYETQRDGTDFIANALRTAPGHLKDENAHVYETR